jgi:RNA polymerase sigma-70 factor (ECF subfamily)
VKIEVPPAKASWCSDIRFGNRQLVYIQVTLVWLFASTTNLIRLAGIRERDLESSLEQLLTEGAKRLLTRAADSRALKPEILRPRIASAVDKYVLRDEPNATAADISSFIDAIQADDLCLIIACEQNDESAWSDLVERFTTTVRSAARSASANEDAAEDLAQSIWAELYGLRGDKDGKRSSKLAYYSGRGSLAGWLRAVVAQLAVDTYRKQSRLVQTEEDTDLDRLARELPMADGNTAAASTLVNPEHVIANRLAGSDMKVALNRAVNELAAEDRLLVKLYYFDGLRLREAGVVLGVHEATASRRLMRIHADLKKRVSQILVKESGWTESETERSFSEIGQYLDSDLEGLLTKEGVS